MRVLYISDSKVSTFSENSNAYQQPYNLCKRHECTVITPSKEFIPDEIRSSAKRIIEYKSNRLFLTLKFYLNTPFEKGTLHIDDFDCIVTDFSEWSCLIVNRIKKLRTIPWYLVLWDPPFGNRYEIKTSLIYRIEQNIRLRIYNKSIHNCNKCFAFINKGVINEENLEFRSVSQLVNGVDTDIIARLLNSEEIKKTPYSICSTGRIRLDKGCKEILDAFELIGRMYTDSTLTLIGQVDGTLKEKELIEKMIESHPYRNRIMVTGRLSFLDTVKTVKNCEIGLHAYSSSRYLYYNHVLKVGEYQALGTIPIATRYPGTEDIIDNNKNGILIDNNSKKCIFEAIDIVFKNKDYSRSMMKYCIEHISERSWRKVTTRMYSEISADLGK